VRFYVFRVERREKRKKKRKEKEKEEKEEKERERKAGKRANGYQCAENVKKYRRAVYYSGINVP
jgi:hypothetical protein